MHVTTHTITITVTSDADPDDIQDLIDQWVDNASYVHDVIVDNLETMGHTVPLVTLGDDSEYHEERLQEMAR
jgi:hypothetical protein